MAHPGRILTTVALVALAGVGGIYGARWVEQTLREPYCEFTVGELSETMTPEQSAHASTISLLSVQRDLPPRAASIAIATAIQESKLRNITYGDRDSIGLFQQRPSQGWGSEEEILDPAYATGKFYDALVKIDGWQEEDINDVAQSVQRSAFPQAYAAHEWQGRVMASALTGQTAAAAVCVLAAPDEPGEATAVADELTALGLSATDEDDTVTVRLADTALTWAVAGWAVTHAEQRQIIAVSADGQTWTRGEYPMEWSRDASTSSGPNTVQIRLSS